MQGVAKSQQPFLLPFSNRPLVSVKTGRHIQPDGSGCCRETEGGSAYISDFFHVLDHVFVTFALLGQPGVIDVVVTLAVHSFSFAIITFKL